MRYSHFLTKPRPPKGNGLLTNSSHMKFKVGSKVRVKNVYSGGNFDDGDIVTIKQIDNEDKPNCYGAISPYDGLMWYLNEDEIEAVEKEVRDEL